MTISSSMSQCVTRRLMFVSAVVHVMVTFSPIVNVWERSFLSFDGLVN